MSPFFRYTDIYLSEGGTPSDDSNTAAILECEGPLHRRGSG